jgi:hypothetical protein
MTESGPNQERQPPLLFFVHVPKTGGTSFATVLRMNEPGTRIRRLGNVFKGGRGGLKNSVDLERTARIVQLSGTRVITGHVPLGLRDYLPDDREVRCCTILRDPVERTLSHYYQRCRNARLDLARKDGLPPSAGATIEAAIEGGYLFDNLQTRMLSGLEDPFGPVDEVMLERAKHNLAEELVTFGLVERFSESVVLAKHRLGLRTILTSLRRVDSERPRGDEVPEDMRREAERWNGYDLELYRYAEQLFDAAPERAELEFCVDLAALAAAQTPDVDARCLRRPPTAATNGPGSSWFAQPHWRSAKRATWPR